MATRPGSAHPSRQPASEAPPHLSAYIGSPIGSHPYRPVGWPVVTPDGSPLHLPPPVSTQVTVTISAGLQASWGVDITVREPETAKSPPVGRALGVDSHLFLSMENYRSVSVRSHSLPSSGSFLSRRHPARGRSSLPQPARSVLSPVCFWDLTIWGLACGVAWRPEGVTVSTVALPNRSAVA